MDILRKSSPGCQIQPCFFNRKNRTNVSMLLILFLTLVSAALGKTLGRDMFPVTIESDGSAQQGSPYYIQPAAFGWTFSQSVYVNFMMPPTRTDDYLCQYPDRLQDVQPIDRTDPKYGVFSVLGEEIPSETNRSSSDETNATFMQSTKYDPQQVKIGLIVRRGFCTIEQKAMVLLKIQQKLNLTGILQFLLIYEDDPALINKVVTFTRPNTTAGSELAGLKDIGIAYLPFNFLPDLEVQMQAASTVIASSNGTTSGIGSINDQDDGGAWNRKDVASIPYFMNGTDNYHWQLLFRIAGPFEPTFSTFQSDDSNYGLFTTIFWFRFALLMLLVFGPCGRALFLWHAGGGRILFRRNDRGRLIGLQYIPPRPWWFSGGQVAAMSATNTDSKKAVLTEEEFQSLPEVIYDGPPPGSENEDENDVVEYQARIDNDIENPEGSKAHLSTACSTNLSPSTTSLPSSTTCTMCSICIDEFEAGEKITLLPKCKHAFHRGCIHPWLLQRQGLCPLCKTPVIDGIVVDISDDIHGTATSGNDATEVTEDTGRDESAAIPRPTDGTTNDAVAISPGSREGYDSVVPPSAEREVASLSSSQGMTSRDNLTSDHDTLGQSSSSTVTANVTPDTRFVSTERRDPTP